MEDAKLIAKDDEEETRTTVPAWLYDELVCGWLTKAAALWWFNLICAVFHFALAVATWIVSTIEGRSFWTPTLTVYRTDLTWVANSTDALRPEYITSGVVYLTPLTMSFFLLSFLAHILVVGFNTPQAWAVNKKNPTHLKRRKVTTWTGWYFLWMHECRNPARWMEYSFSAAVMIVTFAVAAGVAHIYFIICFFVLTWVTMLFGLVTEVLSPPKLPTLSEDPQGELRPQTWKVKHWYKRLLPHVLGYVPYLTVWCILGHSFFSNVSDAPEGGGPPDFVYAILISQFALFTCFGITQLFNQLLPNGPSWYYWGEMSYCALSLGAKGLLGLLLLANVIVYDSFEAAVTAANNQTSV